jgi:hypothetical protein
MSSTVVVPEQMESLPPGLVEHRRAEADQQCDHRGSQVPVRLHLNLGHDVRSGVCPAADTVRHNVAKPTRWEAA